MSLFNSNLFGGNEFSPKRKTTKRKNGKRKKNGNGRNGRNGRNGNGSAKRAARGFESPGFFGGLETGRISGIGTPPKSDFQDIGVQLPALGEGFNSRIGNIGSGFTEKVDTFKIGFSDVLTGNGRTGEIIGGGAGAVTPGLARRKRGRPKGSGKKQRAIGSGRVKSRVLEFDTPGAAELRKQGKLSQIKTKSVGGILAEGVRSKAGSIRERFRGDDDDIVSTRSGFGTSIEALETETDVDREGVQRLRTGIAVEQEVQQDVETLTDEEEEDNGIDEDMDDVKDDDFSFGVEEGEIRRRDSDG